MNIEDRIEKYGTAWVSGGIDSYGTVIGHICTSDLGSSHTPEEKSIAPWRWSLCKQEFLDDFGPIPAPRQLTSEEYFRVVDWLINRGYADETAYSKIPLYYDQ